MEPDRRAGRVEQAVRLATQGVKSGCEVERRGNAVRKAQQQFPHVTLQLRTALKPCPLEREGKRISHWPDVPLEAGTRSVAQPQHEQAKPLGWSGDRDKQTSRGAQLPSQAGHPHPNLVCDGRLRLMKRLLHRLPFRWLGPPRVG